MIFMEEIGWIAGNEKRFVEFISGLGGKDKIALVSHNDLDGVASAKIAYEIVEPNFLKFIDYEELNENLIEELKKNKINKVIFCDLYINELRKDFTDKLKGFDNVLVIDHHPFFFDFNNRKVVFLNAQGYCAAYLCYVMFSKINNLERYDWLVACACLSDFMYHKNRTWMENVFEKYGEEFEAGMAGGIGSRKFMEVTKTLNKALIYFRNNITDVFDNIGNMFGDIGNLTKYADGVQREIDNCVRRFEKEKKKIRGGHFWEFKKGKFNIKSIIATIISSKYFNKTILILEEDGEICKISGRRQDKGDDMNKLLKKLIEGFENADAGGHIPASGGYFPIKYKEEFIKRVKNL